MAIPSYLKPLEAAGLKKIEIVGDQCKVETPSGETVMLAIEDAKNAAKELASLATNASVQINRFGDVKSAKLARAEHFANTLCKLSKNLGQSVVAELLAVQIKSSIEPLTVEATSRGIS